jgi:putative copper export protein
MPEPVTLEAAPKLLGYLATLVCTGVAVTLAISQVAAAEHAWHRDAIAGRVRRLAITAALIGVVALLLRAVGHAALVAGSLDAVTIEALRLVTVESRWGGGWRWQLVAAALAALAAWRLQRPAGLPVFALAVAAWCAATPSLGHGASSLWQRGLHALHLGASGAWIGTVLVLAWCLGTTGTHARLRSLHDVVRRFSPWALTAVAVVGASGLILAVTYAVTVRAFWTTRYGQLLLAKLVIVAAIGACGFGNWRRSRADRLPSPGLIRAEAALAILVVLMTTVLTETEHN